MATLDPPPPYPGEAKSATFNSCPNGCESGVLTNAQLKDHLLDCPLQLVECEFAGAGCDVKVPRRNLATHMTESAQHHLMSATLLNLRLTRELCQKMEQKDKQIAELQKQIHSLTVSNKGGFVCHDLTLTGFTACQARSSNGEWFSKIVGDALGGVKVQLEIDTNGHKPSLKHMTAKLQLADFTVNPQLSRSTIVCAALHMINQLGDYNHHVVMDWIGLYRFSSPVKLGYENKDKYFPLSDLGHNSAKRTQYLVNDTIKFKLYLKVESHITDHSNIN